MKVVGWWYPQEIFIKRTNNERALFKAVLCNNEDKPFTIQLVCWGEKAYEVSKIVKYGMVCFFIKLSLTQYE